MTQAIEHMLQVSTSDHQQPLLSVTSQASDVLFDAQTATGTFDGETLLENGEVDSSGGMEKDPTGSPANGRDAVEKKENGDTEGAALPSEETL